MSEEYVIKKVLDYRSGVSKQDGRPWANQEFIVEKVEDTEYPDELLLKARGERCVEWFGGQKPQYQEGDKVMLGYSSRVTAFQTRDGSTIYRQENVCWRLEKV